MIKKFEFIDDAKTITYKGENCTLPEAFGMLANFLVQDAVKKQLSKPSPSKITKRKKKK